MAPPTVARLLVVGSGGKVQAVRPQVMIELIQGNAGLGPDPSLLRVDLHHAANVLGEIHDHGVVNRLAGKPGAPAPGKHRRARTVAYLDNGSCIIGIAGNDHAHGLHPVDGGVRAVHRLGVSVEPHLALDAAAQLCLLGRR